MTARKQCSKCLKFLLFSDFSKDKKNRYGLASACKTCRREVERDWYRRNPEKVAETRKLWREANRDKRVMYAHRRRGRKRQAAGSYTAEQWQARLEYHGNRCYYCTSEHNLTIDHRIPLSRGGTNWPSNLVPACKSCNSSKHDKTETEYVQM